MRFKLLVLAGLALLATLGVANATARIHVDLSTQTMHVESSAGNYSWPVSTARAGFYTPRGEYAPTGMERMHYSRKYHNSPMPYSIFFRGGYAIHGSYATGALGRPASHGCVRLSPANAARLYSIVQNEGGAISITGAPPASARHYARSETRHHMTHYASHRHTGHRYAVAHAGGASRHHALAYAPAHHQRRHASVRSWQANPVGFFDDF